MATTRLNPTDKLVHMLSQGSEAENHLIEQVAAVHIQDKLVAPKKLYFRATRGKAYVHFSAIAHDAEFVIHPHAFGQMCDLVKLPRKYANHLLHRKEDWAHNLLSHNLQQLFVQSDFPEFGDSGVQRRFLARTVNGELRGWLSRRFNRHLASLPLLRGFISAYTLQGAQAVYGFAGTVSFSLSAFLPKVYTPTPGEHLAVGVTWRNSDFGAGRLTVALSLLRVNSGTTSVLGDVMSKVHLGRVIQDSDLDMSDDTAAKEVDALVGVIHDSVAQWLAPERVERLVAAVAEATEQELSWTQLKAELRRVLGKGDVDRLKQLLEEDVVDLPPVGRTASGDPLPTRWWATNAVGMLAERALDPDEKLALQLAAGGLLGGVVNKIEKESA